MKAKTARVGAKLLRTGGGELEEYLAGINTYMKEHGMEDLMVPCGVVFEQRGRPMICVC